MGADQWIKVSTTSSGGSLYNVSLEGQQVVSVNTSSYGYLPGDSPFYLGPSTVALGGWQDQDAYYRNLVVSDGNGTLIYENNLNGDKVREEFGVTTNAYSQCVSTIRCSEKTSASKLLVASRPTVFWPSLIFLLRSIAVCLRHRLCASAVQSIHCCTCLHSQPAKLIYTTATIST